jgi:IclR family acetate operon transcriptional repressor
LRAADLIVQEEAAEASIDRSSQLARGLSALEALADGPKSASDVARLLDVNRSTALRLLQELRTLGYVARDSESKEYTTVSARIWALVANSPDHVDWSEVVDPILSGLRDEFGEATLMGVPASGSMVYMAFFPSTNPIAVRERLGTVRPMHCSAIGKAYLANLDAEALDVELGRLSYVGGTEHAPRGPMELREHLEDARRQGFAVDRDETFAGGSCVAVPVWIGDSLIGAAGISGPSSRFSGDQLEGLGRRLVAEFARMRRQG